VLNRRLAYLNLSKYILIIKDTLQEDLNQLVMAILILCLLSINFGILTYATTDDTVNIEKNNTINLSSKYGSVILDENNIPIVNYGFSNGTFIGLQRNPVTISQKAISFYESYVKYRDDDSLTSFLNNANWLVNNAVSHNNYSLLEYHFPFAAYNMTIPWRSGMAQGLAVQALAHAYDLTNETKYLNSAKKLLNSFFVEVKDGGVTYKTPNNGWWYEDYAQEGRAESRVLNGMIYAVLGIHEYYKITKDAQAKYLYDQGIVALDRNLPKFDDFGYSYYDMLRKPATDSYHKAHIYLLDKLYSITPLEIFKAFSDRWKESVITN
jgi:heparosan-N-sulfate-glucuronate 5-epimerase